MRLVDATIINYRSIEEVQISFEPECRTLLGINESGKSNILKALALLGDNKPDPGQDMRLISADEDDVKEAYVDFRFKLSKEDITKLYEKISALFLYRKHETPLTTVGGEKVSLEQLIGLMGESIYSVDIETGEKEAEHLELDDCKVNSDWKRVSSNCPPELLVHLSGEDDVTLKDYSYVYCPSLKNETIPKEFLEDIHTGEIISDVGAEIINFTMDNIPDVIVWNFEEAKLLPRSVDKASFGANPESCLPLQSMFYLAGYEDIDETVNRPRSANHFRTTLRNVAYKTTQHFQQVWPEYQDIRFELKENGPNLEIIVQENNDTAPQFEVSQRSDGFKRFVSFLLLISAKVKSGKIENTLLLADEPDMGLHPKGATYLRDELIDISQQKNNAVVFSTHSIFMIDKGQFDRHIRVEKHKDITTAKDAGESDLREEEVLLNALKTSIYELLEQNNVLFEGWTDKKLFEIALSKQRLDTKFDDLKSKTGKNYSKGVPFISHYAGILDSLERNYSILTDADQAAIDKKEEYQEDGRTGEWYTFADLGAPKEFLTSEDFVSPTVFKKAVNAVVSTYKKTDVACPTDRPRMEKIRPWLYRESFSKNEVKKIEREIKKVLFKDLLKPTDVCDEYYNLLEKLNDKLFSPALQEVANDQKKTSAA